MIVKILPSSSDFHAVKYNEDKVNKGTAELLEIKNFKNLNPLGKPTKEDLQQYLIDYTEKRNSRIERAQFHIAISAKEHEKSFDELLEFAHAYLREMGYANEGQPILIYAHHDTGNNHLHIVTSRIAPDGHKINHNHERRRSQDVINRLLGNNLKNEVNDEIQKAKSYSFSSVAQFRAILECSGYDSFEKDGKVHIVKGGCVQESIDTREIENICRQYSKEDNIKRKLQIRAILKKYSSVSANKKQLAETLKKKFGIDLVFFGSKDKPSGYMVIDHKDKKVFKGSDVLNIKKLMDFKSPEERFAQFDNTIDMMLTDNPNLTTKEINNVLWKQFRTYISKGEIVFNGERKALNNEIRAALKINDKIKWIQDFHPATEQERDVLCWMAKLDKTQYIQLTPKDFKERKNTVEIMAKSFKKERREDIVQSLRNSNIRIVRDGTSYFAIDLDRKTIVDFDDTTLNIAKIIEQNSAEQKRQKTIHIKNPLSALKQGGGHGKNREWEVGKKKGYEEEIREDNNIKY